MTYIQDRKTFAGDGDDGKALEWACGAPGKEPFFHRFHHKHKSRIKCPKKCSMIDIPDPMFLHLPNGATKINGSSKPEVVKEYQVGIANLSNAKVLYYQKFT